MWKEAVIYVVKRESILESIEIFETSHSDPKRFYEHGPKATTTARTDEADIRAVLMIELKEVDEKVRVLIDRIKSTQHELLTYKGIELGI